MPKIKVGDSNLSYESHGQGDPLLLVAGLSGLGSYWYPQLRPFSERYRVILHDHRGTGQSDRPIMEYSVDQMAADVLGLMDALGIERAHLVGHSTGGAIGQIIAIDHPERLRALVIANSWNKADAFFIRCFDVRKELLVKGGVASYQHASPLFLYPSWWIKENAERISEEEKAIISGYPLVEIVLSRIEAILAFDRTEKLHTIRTPTLVIGSRDDIVTPPYYSEELASAIPGAKLAMLERGGHVCSQIVPEEFNEYVLSFIADH
ncbi:MAG: pyrimidine utilization protein D [Thermodesulfobacteriota bacterium]